MNEDRTHYQAPDAGPEPGWWMASDGQWYPPELHPDVQAQPEQHPGADTQPTSDEATGVIVKRGHASKRLLPKEPEVASDTVVVQRSVLSRRSTQKPQTSRERKIAGDLPAWEPLPPGELVVTRPQVQ